MVTFVACGSSSQRGYVISTAIASTSGAEHRSVFIEHRPEHAGHAMHTIIVDGFDALVAQIADRGLEPTKWETYSNGVRKATYCDPDGNEIGFGGIPSDRKISALTG
jgi:hypothetical protein